MIPISVSKHISAGPQEKERDNIEKDLSTRPPLSIEKSFPVHEVAQTRPFAVFLNSRMALF